MEKQEDWLSARLLPTAGIRSREQQERRAASALLAVMSAVPDFCHALLSGMKAPKGTISTYTEVHLEDGKRKTHIPDGVMVIERGRTRWSCLVEIKTSGTPLEAEQVARYLDMARQHGFDGLLTISNQIRSDPKALPYSVDRRKIRGLSAYHLSWWRVLTEAIVQHRFRGIEDPDQAWILGELIRYLDDERSGASGFEGMGQKWVRVRESARNGTLRASDPEAGVIAARWEQFVEYLCLHLGQELGVDVKHQRPRRKSPEERIDAAAKQLAADGVLRSSIRVPDAVGPIGVEADLRTRRVTTSVEIQAPKEGRPKTRVRWLLRQLKDAPDDLRIEVRFSHVRATRSELLRDCRESPECLLLEEDPKREPRSFVLAMSKPMGKKRGRKEGSFVAETRRQATEFYRDLLQGLMSPRTKAPKLREDDDDKPQETAPPASEGQVRREHESSLQGLAEAASPLP
ncbi:MAG: stress response protein [Solirubrobacterales bacterium]|nr:stress response protein [Solirubrobacterales bacterium]